VKMMAKVDWCKTVVSFSESI